MDNKTFTQLTQSIQEKIGEENSALIADDLVKLITDNQAMNETISQKEKEILDSNKQKEMLMKSNMNLLQQVGFDDPKPDNEDEKDTKPFDFSSVFDENGNFKR